MMNLRRDRRWTWGLAAALWIVGLAAARAEDAPLTIADLDAYRHALDGKADEKPVAVTFRELWDHPGTYQGHRVEVEGKVARSFRQGPTGVFPALAEVWALTPGANPLCLVFPVKPGQDSPAIGSKVRFVGTFLRRIEYRGGDGPRLAPLIVGDRAPASLGSATGQGRPPRSGGGSAVDWAIGLVVAGLVVSILLAQHLRKPRGRLLRIEGIERPPQFVSGDDHENHDSENNLPA